MYDFLLADVKPEATIPLESFGEKFTVGGGVFLRGMCTVFGVLAIIWLFLSIVRFFVYDLPRRREAEAEATPQKEAAPVAPQSAPAAPVAPAAIDDGELIAVIAAAIAAATAENGGGKFRVVSFHRVNK